MENDKNGPRERVCGSEDLLVSPLNADPPGTTARPFIVIISVISREQKQQCPNIIRLCPHTHANAQQTSNILIFFLLYKQLVVIGPTLDLISLAGRVSFAIIFVCNTGPFFELSVSSPILPPLRICGSRSQSRTVV